MDKVIIRLTEWRTRDGKPEAYSCFVRIRNDPYYAYGDHGKNLRPIAYRVLKNVISENADQIYSIILSEGLHPIRKCQTDCAHFRYTEKPDESARKKLRDLLEDEKLKTKAEKWVKWDRKHPLRIVVLPPYDSPDTRAWFN